VYSGIIVEQKSKGVLMSRHRYLNKRFYFAEFK
jgi:hypothetical protein